jgi:transposase-like protein
MDAILKTQAEKLANELASQVGTLEDLNGLMRTMMKTALERMLHTEMDVPLQRRGPTEVANTTTTPSPEPTPKTTAQNRRNGHSKKTVGSDMGEFTLQTPRDRNSTFEPQLIKKGQRRLEGFDEKILALYAKGMTTRDIQEVVGELYGVEVSAALVSEITADLDAEVSA